MSAKWLDHVEAHQYEEDKDLLDAQESASPSQTIQLQPSVNRPLPSGVRLGDVEEHARSVRIL
jgi:hypothetical protein